MIYRISAVKKTGTVPPGNAKGNKEWSTRRQAAKPEIRLTPGKGIQDLTVPLSDVIQQVVDQNKVGYSAGMTLLPSSPIII